MEAFCNGSPVWNSTLTWQGSWPEFTPCFQQTVLVWGGCGLLWLSSLLYLPHLLSLPSHPQPLSSKHAAKLLGCGVIMVLSLVKAAQSVSGRHPGASVSDHFQADLVAPLVYLVTMLLVILLMLLEKRKDFIISPVLFTFWTILFILNIIPFYSKIILREYEERILDFSLFCLFYLTLLAEVIVHCLTEESAGLVIRDKRPCKEIHASILSRITFQWATGLIVKGYKKPLTEEDVDNLHPRDQSATVVPQFLSNWNRQLRFRRQTSRQTSRQEQRAKNSHQIQASASDVGERTPLLTPTVEFKPDNRGRGVEASLFLTLWKTFGLELLLTHLWKLLYDALILSNPMVLGLLVKFVQDKTDQLWHGYIFALALFLSMLFQSLFFHQLMHRSFSLSLRIKASLLSAIYRKSLRISSEAKKESTAGETVNLMSVDTCNVEDVVSWLWSVWSSPLQCCVSLYLLYSTLGPSMFAGLGFLVILIPLNGAILAVLGSLQDKLMSAKDRRMKIIWEVLNGIKILKLYAWEPSFKKKVSDVRDDELKVLWKSSLLSSVMTFSWTAAPFCVGLLTFLAYVLVDARHWLSPDKAFVSVAYFNILRFAINMLPMILTDTIKAVISLRRINKYLNREEIDTDAVKRFTTEDDAVSIEDGTFAWGRELEPTLTNVSVRVPRGKLVAVVGVVGSGKSSLLSAFLGDMEKRQGQVSLQGSVAYVPQQAWIQNARLKDNVVFGRTLEEGRYQEVLEACALGPDLAVLPAGDLTEIGERGINLSGGQKQRVSLARAVYSQADVFLLDDPLSAVDSHVGKHIFRNVLGESGLLRGKTRVLVTHGVHWLPQVDKIFVLHKGRVRESGTYSELISHNGPFAKFLATYFAQGSKDEDEDEEVVEMKKQVMKRLESVRSDEGDDDDDVFEEEEDKKDKQATERQVSTVSKTSEAGEKEDKPNKKDTLTEEEKVETGSVKLSVFVAYMRALGMAWFMVAVVAYCLYQAAAVATNVWLSSWTDDLDLANFTIFPANSSERHDRNDYYLWGYGGLGMAQVAMIVIYTVIARLCAVRASRILHQKLLHSVLRAPMSFFDTTPTGRVVNRFSMDMDIIDTSLPLTMEIFLDCASMTTATLVVISYSTPIFLSVIIPLFIFYFFVQRYYVATSRQLQRLESKSRSPIYNNFGETLAGVSVIRAFRMQERFIQESELRVDHNQCFSSNNYASNRWLGFRLEQLGNIIVLLAGVLAVAARDTISAGVVGLSISYALEVTSNLNFLVRMACDMETQIVAVERVIDYSKLTSEDEWDKGRELLPPDWPQQGHIQFQEYSCRYRPGLELVLHTLSCDVRPGEKVGIVGRTGAGKSSLTLSLFRLIEPASGRICIDSLDICSLGLHQLREHLTILPQDPVLFAGTLRMNLDPFDQYSDTEVWTALEHAHLKSFVWELPARLQHLCGEGGENLSVGQRQLLCLARTLLRKTRILVFDEATAAVDLETDDLIQQTIRSEFKDCTVLTIAHRLNTVMDYNRILVLDKGKIAEFDSPDNLLKNTDGIFYQMAKDASII